VGVSQDTGDSVIGDRVGDRDRVIRSRDPRAMGSRVIVIRDRDRDRGQSFWVRVRRSGQSFWRSGQSFCFPGEGDGSGDPIRSDRSDRSAIRDDPIRSIRSIRDPRRSATIRSGSIGVRGRGQGVRASAFR